MFQKIFKRASKRSIQWAMSILNLDPKDIRMLKRLRTEEDRNSWSMRRLGVNEKDLKIVKQIKDAGGITQFILKQTGIESLSSIRKYKEWQNKSKLQKIKELCPNPEEIRDFFNQSYVHYRKMKKDIHNTWKFKGGDKKSGEIESHRKHLLDISNKIHTMIQTDECTQEDFLFVSSKAFMAFWCYAQQQKKKIGRAADRVLGSVEQQMAA